MEADFTTTLWPFSNHMVVSSYPFQVFFGFTMQDNDIIYQQWVIGVLILTAR